MYYLFASLSQLDELWFECLDVTGDNIYTRVYTVFSIQGGPCIAKAKACGYTTDHLTLEIVGWLHYNCIMCSYGYPTIQYNYCELCESREVYIWYLVRQFVSVKV